MPSSSAALSTDLGALPQTDTEPGTTGAAFKRHATSLWRAIVDDDPDEALGFFFPRSAYVQIKAISDPAGDWQDRLVADFGIDVHSLHEQLGTDATRATFTGLDVPDGRAEWIVPGVEYNSGSYWRVFGSTLHYEVGGVDHDLPVTSLISWRGEWYVVHLGAIR